MARAWFFLVLLNSSSFSATRLSISCLTLASSSWARSTLFSSISRVASASSRAPCSSSFSVSNILPYCYFPDTHCYSVGSADCHCSHVHPDSLFRETQILHLFRVPRNRRHNHLHNRHHIHR